MPFKLLPKNNIPLPKVTVVIPCFNHGRYLMEAVGSVEACPKELYEMIIVNDGSTEPSTCQLIQKLEAAGYPVIHQPHSGLAAARNHGIRQARGAYILPLDADNKIRPGYIVQAVKILDDNEAIGVVYGDAEYFGDHRGRWEAPEFNLLQMIACNKIDACAVFRKSIWEACGGYDTSMVTGYEDWDLWLQMASRRVKFFHIKEVLFDYHVRPDSMLRAWTIPNEEKILPYLYAKHFKLIRTEIEKQLRLAAGRNRSLKNLFLRWREKMFYACQYARESFQYYIPNDFKRYVRRPPPSPGLISIVIPVYCQKKYEACFQAFQKLLGEYLPAQTHQHYEAMIISDGPDPKVRAFVKSLNDPRNRLIELNKTHGHWGHVATKIGISSARGSFFVRMNQDNHPYPDYLETLYRGFAGNVDFVYARVEFKGLARETYKGNFTTPGTFMLPMDQGGLLQAANIDCMNYMVRMPWARRHQYHWKNRLDADWCFVEALLKHGAKTGFIDKKIGDKY